MTAEPWFDSVTQIWLGAGSGVFGGLWGSALGVLGGLLVPKGKGKGVIFGLLWLGLFVGVGMLLAGAVAVATGQPYGVWFVLLQPGMLLTLLSAPFLLVVRYQYRQVELRKMQAEEIM
mgnify:CR=1 FL=1